MDLSVTRHKSTKLTLPMTLKKSRTVTHKLFYTEIFIKYILYTPRIYIQKDNSLKIRELLESKSKTLDGQRCQRKREHK